MNTQEGGGVNQGPYGVTQDIVGVNEGVSSIGHKDDTVGVIVTDEVYMLVNEGVSGLGLKETVDKVEKLSMKFYKVVTLNVMLKSIKLGQIRMKVILEVR
ncbi:hypothetical protein L1887_11582 [Cichorium endivia]|nr:hypothetical protein L1887_11582 [Cichorium endivia]